MKKLFKKGFTLIELLAVIVLLAVIFVIVTPNINDALESSKKQSFKLTVDGIYKSINNDRAESGFTTDSKYVYSNKLLTKVKENGILLSEPVIIKTEGKLMDSSGEIIIDNAGNVIVRITNNKWCGYNNELNKDIQLTDGDCDFLIAYTDESCFEFNSNTGTIINYKYDGNKCSNDVMIPKKINDVTVRQLGLGSFTDNIGKWCWDDNRHYQVDLDYVHYEGDGYNGCYFDLIDDRTYILTSVKIPNIIEVIGDAVFAFNDLENLDFSNLSNLTTIGYDAFYNNQLTSVDFSDLTNLTTIGNSAFGWNQLTNINLSGLPNLLTIGNYAFSDNQLTSIDLSNLSNLTTIGYDAFSWNQLTSIDLSNLSKLTTIGHNAFSRNRLTSIDLSNLPNLTTIGDSAFSSNELINIILPGSIIQIDNYAFSKSPFSNYGLTTIINPTGRLFDWGLITDTNSYECITCTVPHPDGNITISSN